MVRHIYLGGDRSLTKILYQTSVVHRDTKSADIDGSQTVQCGISLTDTIGFSGIGVLRPA